MTAGEVGRWPAPALPPALLSPPETAARTGDRSQRSGWRGAGAHTPPPGAFAPHSRTTGDVARPACLRRSRGVRSFTFHFRESKCLVFEGALEKKRVVHTGDAEPLSPSGCPRLPGRRDHSVGGDPGQLPPGWARSRPKVPPRRPVLDRKWAVRSPGPLTGFGCAGQGGRRRGAQRELMDSMLTCRVRQSPGHGLGRRRGPEGQERRVVGSGTQDFLSGARWDWLQAGWAWGAMGRALASSSGADTMSPRVLPRPSVHVSASSSQTGLGTALGLHFTLVTSLKTPSTHSPVMRGGGGQRCTGGPGGRSPARDRPRHAAGGAGPGPVGCTGPCRAVSGRAVLPGRGPRPAPTDGQAAHPRRRRKVTRTAMGRRKPHHELRSGQALRVNEAD